MKFLSSSEWGTESFIPSSGIGRISEAGVPVTNFSAYGVPAVASVIRSPADLIAAMPFVTYRQNLSDPRDSFRDRAEDTWQWELFHERPCDECDPFQFFYDLEVSLEATQNAFIQKAKLRNEVVALYVLDPQRVRVYCDPDDASRKLFDIYVGPYDVRKGLTTDDICHVRGFTLRPGDVAGTSLLDICRDPVGSAIAMQKFEGDYFRNHAVPPIFFTGSANKQQAQDIADLHNAKHRGAGNQWKAGSLWGETDVKSIPISLKDAMFIEAKNMSIEDVCRIWRWPRSLMEIGEVREPTMDWNVIDSHMLKIYILPRLRRIERAFAADPDIFYGSNLYGEFLTASLERGDVHTRYDAYRLARQGGWVTANELRAMENFPPHENGDELQETPVGGAVNKSTPPPDSGPIEPSKNGHSKDLARRLF
jgi:HK97 family phage portal protein